MPEVKVYEGQKIKSFLNSNKLSKHIFIVFLLFLTLKITDNVFIALSLWLLFAFVSNYFFVKQQSIIDAALNKKSLSESLQEVLINLLKTYCILIISGIVIYAISIRLIYKLLIL